MHKCDDSTNQSREIITRIILIQQLKSWRDEEKKNYQIGQIITKISTNLRKFQIYQKIITKLNNSNNKKCSSTNTPCQPNNWDFPGLHISGIRFIPDDSIQYCFRIFQNIDITDSRLSQIELNHSAKTINLWSTTLHHGLKPFMRFIIVSDFGCS